MHQPGLPPPDPATRVMSSQPADDRVRGADAEIAGPPKLFISYRRDDTRALVEALDDRLRQDLGTNSVFRDVQNLIAGERFEARIMQEIERSDAVLVVIGPSWAGSTGDGSRPSRLDDPDDFVRREVRAALDQRSRSIPMPVLVDGASFPPSLPPELEAIKEHHYVEFDGEQLARKDSPGYQRILVGTWVAKLRSVPNGVIVFGDDSPTAKARLDELVEDMKKRNLVDVSRISRYACGAQVLSLRKARNLARRFPAVIIVVDPESTQSEVLETRTAEMAHHRVAVAVLAVGGGITFGAGVATGTGALHGLSSALASALTKLAPTKVVTTSSRLLAWHAMVPTSTKLAVGGFALAAAGAGLALPPLFDDDPEFALAGDWNVGTFDIDVSGNARDFESFDGGTMSFRNIDPDCDGSDCSVVVTDGPDFLVGARIEPGNEGTLATTFATDETETIRALTGLESFATQATRSRTSLIKLTSRSRRAPPTAPSTRICSSKSSSTSPKPRPRRDGAIRPRSSGRRPPTRSARTDVQPTRRARVRAELSPPSPRRVIRSQVQLWLRWRRQRAVVVVAVAAIGAATWVAVIDDISSPVITHNQLGLVTVVGDTMHDISRALDGGRGRVGTGLSPRISDSGRRHRSARSSRLAV